MKLKTFVVLGVFLLASHLLMAQDTKEKPEYGWHKEMVGGLNLTQTSFDNWTQGGENSTAWQMNFNFKFVNDQVKTNWSNTGKFTYGQTKTGEAESRKSIDEIKLESVLTYKLAVLINPFVAATGQTQFAPGYSYSDDTRTMISAFMDPGYFRQSIGIGIKPNETVQTRLGAALKQTVTRKYPKPYADDPATPEVETFKSEVGIESVTDVNWKLNETTLYTSKLELFSALGALDETDINWDNLFTTKISKYFNVNFNVKIFYDKDISAKRQIKQALALGLTYTFL